MFVGFLEHGVESSQDVAIMLLQQTAVHAHLHIEVRIEYIQQGFVVFVNQDYGTTSAFPMGGFQQILEPVARRFTVRVLPVKGFLVCQEFFYSGFQCPFSRKAVPTKRQMKHRILRPLLFHGIDGEALEQVFSPLEVVLQGRDQQAFTEAARTAEEIHLPFRGHTVYQGGLIHIDITIPDDAFKVLYSYRIFHTASILQRNKISFIVFHRRGGSGCYRSSMKVVFLGLLLKYCSTIKHYSIILTGRQ